MNSDYIVRILREAALILKHDFDVARLHYVEVNNRSYDITEFAEFKRDLLEAGSKIRMLFLEYTMDKNSLDAFVEKEDNLILIFQKESYGLIPVLISGHGTKQQFITISNTVTIHDHLDWKSSSWLVNNKEEIIFFIVVTCQSLVSEYGFAQWEKGEDISTFKRLLRLLSTERNDIFYIFFYALIIGLFSLILPLGIQSTVELISGGVFFSSVYVLIAVVIVGILVAGVLQILQISLVEYLQQRIFTKAALEFAFRIPRVKIESILSSYAPELVNRFFDIMTIQKGLPKLLIDLSSAVLQILFGLLLLSLYHPFFVFFTIVLAVVLVLLFSFTGPRGLHSSIQESKYKYKVAQWLEELARAMNSFKLSGTTDLPIRKTDYNVNNYLKYRKVHFQTLLTQFSFILFFKAAITGGLLIIGTILVVQREITLGQFVASEVIIILILNALEKIIMYMDVVSDLLTAVDKVAHVTDLPLEKAGGLNLPRDTKKLGYAISIKDLRYKYADGNDYALRGINLDITAGERVCITGPGGGGKTTLINIISGLYTGFEGIVTINNHSIRDLDLSHLRDKIARNISPEDVFDGSLYDNVTVGKPMESVEDAINALRNVGLADEVNALPHGLDTAIVSGGKGLSSSFIQKLILARCLAKNPALLILNNFFCGLNKSAKQHVVNTVISADNAYTLLAVSNDPLVMSACKRVVVINEGVIVAQGSFDKLVEQGIIGA